MTLISPASVPPHGSILLPAAQKPESDSSAELLSLKNKRPFVSLDDFLLVPFDYVTGGIGLRENTSK